MTFINRLDFGLTKFFEAGAFAFFAVAAFTSAATDALDETHPAIQAAWLFKKKSHLL